MVLLATVVAVWLLWLADRWGLGQGGELLFAVCLVGGGAWLADKYFAFLGVLIFLVARRIVPQVSEIPGAGNAAVVKAIPNDSELGRIGVDLPREDEWRDKYCRA